MNNLQSAEKYIEANKQSVNKKYRPEFHLSPPVGWMNDPNGLVYFNGRYHLFYQYNPYDTKTGAMYWGHAVSDDLYSFEHLKPAIAPEEEGESIFSGGAYVADGKLVAMYTRHFENDGVKKEEVYITESADGIDFPTGKKIFDNSSLPANISRADFRDPCPAVIDGKLYVFLGGKDIEKNKGLIVVLGGTEEKLKYLFSLGFDELGDMGECPSYARVDGKDVLIASGCNVPQRGNSFKNINSSVFIVGEIDFGKGEMQVDFIKEIDKGDCFYAPQFINGAPRPVMLGWQEMWGKKYPVSEWGHGWTGAFSSPRELKISDGEIFQIPAKGYEKYFTRQEKTEGCAVIAFTFEGAGEVKISAEDFCVFIGLDGGIYLDTTKARNLNGCIRRTDNLYKRAEVEVFLDKSGIEVFIDGGREVISSRIYPEGELAFSAQGRASGLKIKSMGNDK